MKDNVKAISLPEQKAQGLNVFLVNSSKYLGMK